MNRFGSEPNDFNPSLRGPHEQGAQRRVRHFRQSAFFPTPVVFVVMVICVVLGVLSMITDLVHNYLDFMSGPAYLEPWRFVTSGFAHFGPVHLVLNMWALYLLGPPLERLLGWWRFTALFLLSTVGGSVCVLAWEVLPGTTLSRTAGASAAIYGLLAALLVLHKRLSIEFKGILILVVVNFLWGFAAPGVSWQGHAGGFLAGLLYALVVLQISSDPRARGASPSGLGDYNPAGIGNGQRVASAIGAPVWVVVTQVALTVAMAVGLYLVATFLYSTVGL